MRRFLVLSRHTEDYFCLEQQTSLNYLQKVKVIETAQPTNVRNKHEVLHSALVLLTRFVTETLLKVLCSFRPYDAVHANVLKMDATRKYEVPTNGK